MSINIVTHPFTRINDTINLSDRLSSIVHNEQLKLININFDNRANDPVTQHQLFAIQKSFLYVCTETVFNYPTVYLTEKSYKGITVKRPFVILGAPGSLRTLQNFGFKTFNQWWNEDYDSILSDQKRLMKIYAIIKFISKKNIVELEQMLNEMSSILEHNFTHYQTFCNSELKNFNQQCILNIKR